jgi:hypothetical protein
MSVLMVNAKVKEESAAEAKAAAQKMFAAIHQEHPANIRYGSCTLADGVTFVVLLEVEEGTENPLQLVCRAACPTTDDGCRFVQAL